MRHFGAASNCPEEAIHLFALQLSPRAVLDANEREGLDSVCVPEFHQRRAWTRISRRPRHSSCPDRPAERSLADLSRVALQDRKLAAADLHGLVARDPHRMLLQWIGEPERVRKSWTPEQWIGFVTISRQKFGLHPEKDGVLVAAERLAGERGIWDEVWNRFKDAPTGYPGVRDALSRVGRTGLLDHGNERLPAINTEQEEDLQKALLLSNGMNRAEALELLSNLVFEHQGRAVSVWAELGEAPLARAVSHLEALVQVVRTGVPGPDWKALAQFYSERGWRADAAAWRAFAEVRQAQDVQAVTAALRAVYLPWLEELGVSCQHLHSSYPNKGPASARRIPNEEGTAIVFVDGLRMDLARNLEQTISTAGHAVSFDVGWSALPTVTATAKPAWRPLADHVNGANVSATFRAAVEG